MKNVKLKKVSKNGATFDVFNEAKKLCGFLICMFVGDNFEWHSNIPEKDLENFSEIKAKAISQLNEKQHLEETALPI